MTIDDFNAFCGSLPHTTHVVQWRGAHVWKVAGKMFAIARPPDGDTLKCTFKCSEMSYHLMIEQPGLIPAPHLASRGMLWVQRTTAETLDDEGLKDYVRESYRLVSLGLPKKVQKELGLNGLGPH